MLIHQIRNATLIITYNQQRFLIDPWLMPKDYMPGFDGAVHADIRQPRVELSLSIQEIVNVDAVILTHFHPDHWDEFAANALDKNIPFFVQSQSDFDMIKNFGFNNVSIIGENTQFKGVHLHKTGGQHGKREIVEPLWQQIAVQYDAMGIVFQAEGEKTLYLAGDTIWCKEVKDAIDTYSPDIIIVNACGASLLNGEKIIMDANDIKAISDYSPSSTIIASHMGTVSHLTVTRDDIKALGLKNVLVPDDNTIMEF